MGLVAILHRSDRVERVVGRFGGLLGYCSAWSAVGLGPWCERMRLIRIYRRCCEKTTIESLYGGDRRKL